MSTDEPMHDHYDFSKGVQGKYRHLIGQSHTIKIRQPDGSVSVEVIQPAIELDPEVRKYFPDSGAVNRALRGLIALIPKPSSDQLDASESSSPSKFKVIMFPFSKSV
ncbi:MAG: hypothetical protein AAF267_09855 [Deinococcota bacterium]